MLTENNEALMQAAETAYVLSADEQIRLQCQAREEYYRDQRYMQKRLDRAEKELEKRNEELLEKDIKIQEKDIKIQEKDIKIQEKDIRIQELIKENALLKSQLSQGHK